MTDIENQDIEEIQDIENQDIENQDIENQDTEENQDIEEIQDTENQDIESLTNNNNILSRRGKKLNLDKNNKNDFSKCLIIIAILYIIAIIMYKK